MGWGKVRVRPATDAEKLIELRAIMKREHDLSSQQIAELTEVLFVKYLECPDKDTQKILIAYMGSEFFRRTK